jgi:RimJ/RimL family protein N-acetyltransferase
MEKHEITLLPVTSEQRQALQDGPQRLGALLGLSVPDGWPQFPEAFAPSAREPDKRWPGYLFVHLAERALVGNGGFVGPPNAEGEVEIGYEIAPGYWNRGFATSAVRAILRYAFAAENVRAVIAHTLAERNASNAVLKKAGFVFVAERPDPEVGAVWLWRASG